MITEFEIKILEVELSVAEERLKKLGAVYVGRKDFKRYVYDAKPACYEKWLRLRTDGIKTEMTFKEIVDETAVDGVKEREVVVDDFAMTNKLLEQLGYTPKAYQENNRISYRLNDCDIEIDQWPLIPSYIEIEGPSSEKVMETVGLLGFTEKETTSENTTAVYKRYGIHDLEAITHLSFDTSSSTQK